MEQWAASMHVAPVEKCIGIVLSLGRVFGAIPLTGTLNWHRRLQFRMLSKSAVYSCLIACVGFLYALALPFQMLSKSHNHDSEATEGGQPWLDKIHDPMHFVYKLFVFFVFTYFLLGSKRLIMRLQSWHETVLWLHTNVYQSQFGWIRRGRCEMRKCLALTVLVMLVGISENSLYDLSNFRKYESFYESKALWEKYIWQCGESLAKYAPYHPITAIIFLFFSKMSNYTWNFAHVFIVIFCRQITFQMERFHDYVKESIRIQDSGGKEIFILKMKRYKVEELDWGNVRRNFFLLCQVTQKIADFISPLLLFSYGCNILFIIITLLEGFHGQIAGERSAYNYMAIVQFSSQIILVTYSASELYHSTESFSRTLDRCPESMYSLSATRLERYLWKHPVHICLLGVIRITRNFFVSIIGFLFTTEIILLQSMSSQLHSKKHQ